jgi:hypothetical protein
MPTSQTGLAAEAPPVPPPGRLPAESPFRPSHRGASEQASVRHLGRPVLGRFPDPRPSGRRREDRGQEKQSLYRQVVITDVIERRMMRATRAPELLGVAPPLVRVARIGKVGVDVMRRIGLACSASPLCVVRRAIAMEERGRTAAATGAPVHISPESRQPSFRRCGPPLAPSPRSVPGEEDNAPVAKLDWDKAKRVSPDVEPNPIRPPSDRELGFLETQQARLRREAAVRRERDWLLLDADRRPVASARAESAERAREQFKARGLAGAWLRQVGERR